MGNREMKDPLIFKDFKEAKASNKCTIQQVKTNFMAHSNNITLKWLTEVVEVVAEVAEE